MIKHIKRKTVRPIQLKPDQLNEIAPEKASENVLKNIKFNDVKNYNAFQLMESGEVLFSFFYNDHGNACAIPLANPVLIYFNIAQSHLRTIYTKRKDLLSLFRDRTDVTEDVLKLFYDFFGLTSSFITMLMTSVEAFVNQQIDKDFKYEKLEQKKYLKVYNYEQILRWVSLEDKINDILNKKFSKDFAKKYPNKNIFIMNLKQLRDQIVHTKEGINHTGYIEIYRQSLNFKFSECIEAVRDFINFYELNLLEPCPCSIDS